MARLLWAALLVTIAAVRCKRLTRPSHLSQEGVELWAFQGDFFGGWNMTGDNWTLTAKGCDMMAAAGIGLHGLGLFTGHVAISYDVGTPLNDAAKRIYGFNPKEFTRSLLPSLIKAEASVPGVVSDDTALFKAAEKLGFPIWKLHIPSPRCQEPSCGYAKMQELYAGKEEAPLYGLSGKTGVYNCQLWPNSIGIKTPSMNPSTTAYLRETLGKYKGQFQCYQRDAGTKYARYAPPCPADARKVKLAVTLPAETESLRRTKFRARFNPYSERLKIFATEFCSHLPP